MIFELPVPVSRMCMRMLMIYDLIARLESFNKGRFIACALYPRCAREYLEQLLVPVVQIRLQQQCYVSYFLDSLAVRLLFFLQNPARHDPIEALKF